MKIGMYSVTYRGVWYKGAAVKIFDLLPLAKKQGGEGVELDTERLHAGYASSVYATGSFLPATLLT